MNYSYRQDLDWLITDFTARVVDVAHVPGLRDLCDADLVLVRPDQHVAWRGASVADPQGMLNPGVLIDP